MTCAFFNSCIHNYDYATGDNKHTEAQPLSRLYIRIFACDTQNLDNPFCADSIRYRFIMRMSTYMVIEYVLVCVSSSNGLLSWQKKTQQSIAIQQVCNTVNIFEPFTVKQVPNDLTRKSLGKRNSSLNN